MIDSQQALNASKTIAFQIQLDRFQAHFWGVAVHIWLRCVILATFITTIFLAAGLVEPYFALLLLGLASWTFHLTILIHL